MIEPRYILRLNIHVINKSNNKTKSAIYFVKWDTSKVRESKSTRTRKLYSNNWLPGANEHSLQLIQPEIHGI